ncbi:acetyl-CoA synthetase-like protein [Neoconidiobolus thromboides FSU 785]|nr:acetyl-CoA synthetase-like protein [Neoconidiobolus thromboides FSU 785]
MILMKAQNSTPRSLSIEGTATKDSSVSYISSLFPQEDLLLPSMYYNSPFEAFCKYALANPSKIAIQLSTSKLTADQLLKQILKFGLGYKKLFTASSSKSTPSSPPMLGLCLSSSPDWLIIDLACQGFSIISVVFNENFTMENLIHGLNQTKLKVLVGGKILLKELIKIKDKLKYLECFILGDEKEVREDEVTQEYPFQVINIEKIYELGTKQAGIGLMYLIPKSISSDTISTIAYTSGTTSLPKGVLLSNQNLTCALFNSELAFSFLNMENMKSMEYLSYSQLPIRVHAYLSLIKGQTLLFCTTGEKESGLLEEIVKWKPNQIHLSDGLMKQLLQLIYSKVNENGMKFELNKLMEVLSLNEDELENIVIDDELRRVFLSIQQLIGEQLRLITSFNYSIYKNKFYLLKLLFNVPIIQSYGLTETTGQGFRTSPDEHGYGVGGVVPLTMAKLVNCAELEYSITDEPCPRGEIYLKGPHLFLGYYGESKSPLTKQGWYPTGDIGSLDRNNGIFTIIDRKANFFKLKEGIYITPEKIESAYKKLSLIEEIYVPTLTLNQATNVIAIIYPNLDHFLGWASYHLERVILNEELMGLCGDKSFKQGFLNELNRQQKSLKILVEDEMVKNFEFVLTPFSSNQEFVTVNHRFKRSHLKSHYSQIIETLANHSIIDLESVPKVTINNTAGYLNKLKSLL